MASVTGSRLAFFAPGFTGAQVNVALTPDGSSLAAPIAGSFNIEVFTASPSGGFSLAPGYQAAAFVQGAVSLTNNLIQAATIGSAEVLGPGNYVVIDQTGSEQVTIAGSGASSTSFSSITFIGSGGDTITGSSVSGNTQLIDASNTNPEVTAGPMTIVGGAGPTTVWAAGGDSIVGGTGSLLVAGNKSNNMTITGGGGGLDAFNFGTGNSVTGSASGTTFIDDNYGGSHNTIGGGGGSTTIIGGPSDLIRGGAGTMLLNALDGTSTMTGGSGAGTVWGGASESIVGGTGSLEFAGNAANGDTVVGGAGNLFAFNFGTHDSVVGSSGGTTFIDDSYGSGSTNTLSGGAGATTIISGSGDILSGGTGALEARVDSNLPGTETVNLSSAAAGVRDVSVLGGGGTNATVTGFSNNSSNAIESATSVNASNVFLGTSSSSGGNTTLSFLDGSTMTLIGVASVSAIKFTQ